MRLSLFKSDKPTFTEAYDLFRKGEMYNTRINLYDTVKANENFYVGKQWEGVQANGLPTPVFNFIKRVVGFTVATITTDNIKVQASALEATANTQQLNTVVKVVNDEFARLIEQVRLPKLCREFTRNSAVDGDGCIYTYWDADMETGEKAKGGIRSEIIENDRVFFGNPMSRDVQSQPYIIISKRKPLREVRRDAKENGIATWQLIAQDQDGEDTSVDDTKRPVDDDFVTDLLILWKADKDVADFCKAGEICAYEFTQTSSVKEPWSLGITRYPIEWLSWDYVKDCYHGQAMVTGIIPNQIYVNKQWALYMISNMRGAYGQKIYDATRIKRIDNRVGAAIPVNGPVNNAVDTIDPTPISPQVVESFNMAVEMTEKCLGATAVALGDTRPDNTSAIIALQRAASTPHELTKQNLYDAIEGLFRTYLEFMAEYYGKRMVDVEAPQFVSKVIEFAQGLNPDLKTPDEIPVEFDFNQLKNHPMTLKLDAGASTYYSEIASMQTLDNLLRNGNITTLQYLERIPDDYIPQRRTLIAELQRQQEQQEQAMQAQQVAMSTPLTGGINETPIPETAGNSAMQREIVNGAM